MALPADTPVTTPVVLMVATAVLLLAHVPPLVAWVSVMLLPTHTLSGPLMGPGVPATLMVSDTEQPVAVSVKVMVMGPP
jgi:hypothetical protein